MSNYVLYNVVTLRRILFFSPLRIYISSSWNALALKMWPTAYPRVCTLFCNKHPVLPISAIKRWFMQRPRNCHNKTIMVALKNLSLIKPHLFLHSFKIGYLSLLLRRNNVRLNLSHTMTWLYSAQPSIAIDDLLNSS